MFGFKAFAESPIAAEKEQAQSQPYVESGYWEYGYAEGDQQVTVTNVGAIGVSAIGVYAIGQVKSSQVVESQTSVDASASATLPSISLTVPSASASIATIATASIPSISVSASVATVAADALIVINAHIARQTFAVTVQSTANGNKYYIDGTQQASLSLHEEGIYRFDVSDSSLSGHPFKFSTTSDGTHNSGSEYTTNVTTVGTAGNSGAYVEIEVTSSTPDLYYYCGNHSGMGGSVAFGVYYSQVPFIIDATEFTVDTQADATASVSAGDNTLTAAEATATGAAEATFADSIEVGITAFASTETADANKSTSAGSASITAFASTETADANKSTSAGSASTTATSIAVSIQEFPDAFITSTSSSSLGVTAPSIGVSQTVEIDLPTINALTAPAATLATDSTASASSGSASTTAPSTSATVTADADVSISFGSNSTTSPAVESTGTATVNVSSGSTTSTSVGGSVQGEATASGAFASASVTTVASSVAVNSAASAGVATASTSAPSPSTAATSNASVSASAGSTTSTSINGSAAGGAEAQAAVSSVDLNASEPTVTLSVSPTVDVDDLISNYARVTANKPQAIVNASTSSVSIVTTDQSFTRTASITGLSGNWTWVEDTPYVFHWTWDSSVITVKIYSTSYDSSTSSYTTSLVATRSTSRTGLTLYNAVAWSVRTNGDIYIHVPFSQSVTGGYKVGYKQFFFDVSQQALYSSSNTRSTIYGAVYNCYLPNTETQGAPYSYYFHTKDANYAVYYRVRVSTVTNTYSQNDLGTSSFSNYASTTFFNWDLKSRSEYVTVINKEARYTAETLNVFDPEAEASTAQQIAVSDLPTLNVTTLSQSAKGGATGSGALTTLNITAFGNAEQGTADASVSGFASANLSASIDASASADGSISSALDTLDVTAADVTSAVTEEPNSLPTLNVTAPVVGAQGNGQYTTPDSGLTLPTSEPEAGPNISSTATLVDAIASAQTIAPQNAYNPIAANREQRNATALPPFATTGAFTDAGDASTSSPGVGASADSAVNVSAGDALTNAPVVNAEGDSGPTLTDMPTLTVTAPAVRADISVNVSVGSASVTEPVDSPQGAANTGNETFTEPQTQAPQAAIAILATANLPTIYTGAPEAQLTTVAQGALPTLNISSSPSVDVDAEQNAQTGPEYDIEISPLQGYAFQYQQPIVDRLIIVARETRFIEVAEENRQVNVEFENRIIEVV